MDFEKSREEQLEHLVKFIENKAPPGWCEGFKVNVFTYEASLGKTWVIKNALAEMYRKDKDFKTLFVTKFKSDGEEYIAKSINNEVGEEIAIAINSENKNNYTSEDLKKYPIVVITHSNYKILQKSRDGASYSLDNRVSERYDSFFKRNLVVIDEEIMLFQIEKLTKLDIEKLNEDLKQLDTSLYEEFQKLFSLKEIIKIDKYYKRISLQISEYTVDKFLEKLDTTVTYDLIKRRKCSFTKEDLCRKIERLKTFSGDNLLLDTRENVHSMEAYKYYTGLKTKKILLDASGKFSNTYDGGKFKVHRFPRIKSNENITLHYGKLNTSGSYKDSKDERHEEIYKYLHKVIKENSSEKDKVLIIGRNDDKKYLREKFKMYFDNDSDKRDYNSNFSFENYQSMRGKDEYGDYQKLFIIHTDNLPKENYILGYEFYTGEILEDDKLKFNAERFIYEPLEKYRQNCILSSFYQAAKRIGRHNDLNKKHDIFIFTREEHLIRNRLKDELKDVELKYVKVPDLRKTRSDSKIFDFINYLEELECGKYKKKDIKSSLEISGVTFNSYRSHKVFLEFQRNSRYLYDFNSKNDLSKTPKTEGEQEL